MQTKSTTTVRLVLSVEVDRETWGLTYGDETDAATVRDAVRRYVVDMVQNCPAADEDAIVEVTAR
jgi:hypothetical protein